MLRARGQLVKMVLIVLPRTKFLTAYVCPGYKLQDLVMSSLNNSSINPIID